MWILWVPISYIATAFIAGFAGDWLEENGLDSELKFPMIILAPLSLIPLAAWAFGVWIKEKYGVHDS